LLRLARVIGGQSRHAVSWSAVSQAVARQANSALAVDVELLPNGTSLPFWRAPRPNGRRPSDRIVFVTAGRLERKKRPIALVRAFMEARRRTGIGAELLIAGDGGSRGAVERAAGEPAHSGVRLLGWRDRDALRDSYTNADAFVLASEREAFGIAALEARAAGLPVIAMRSAGCADFLTHGRDALLCADDADLVTQLCRFLVDEDLRARLRSAHCALDQYDWSAVVRAHETTYTRAITRAGRLPVAVPTS
jgi:glycosyltransferase involved in cell wall biosynthesis